MILYDTHVHTAYSTDSDTPVRTQLDSAAAHGLAGICLTDHMDYGFPPDQYDITLPEGEPPFCYDTKAYQTELKGFQKKYNDLDILIGVECGLQTRSDILQKNKELSEDPEFDYMIGSLHLTGRKDPYNREFWKDRNPADCIRQYLEELYDNLCSFTGFDSLGHLDYIVRYARDDFHYEPVQYRELIEEILKLLVRKDIALEINTSGYRSVGNPNPHPDILAWYRELGGEMVTIGSDAHTPEFLAYQFDLLPSLARTAGLHQYVTFHQRRPRFHSFVPE